MQCMAKEKDWNQRKSKETMELFLKRTCHLRENCIIKIKKALKYPAVMGIKDGSHALIHLLVGYFTTPPSIRVSCYDHSLFFIITGSHDMKKQTNLLIQTGTPQACFWGFQLTFCVLIIELISFSCLIVFNELINHNQASHPPLAPSCKYNCHPHIKISSIYTQ